MFPIKKFYVPVSKDGRRLDRRLTYRQTVRYRIDQGPFQKAELEDVSHGGMRVRLPRYVPKGARVQVLYHQPLSSRQHWVEGQVRWSQEVETLYATGVEIDFQSDSDEAPFRNLVDQLATAS